MFRNKLVLFINIYIYLKDRRKRSTIFYLQKSNGLFRKPEVNSNMQRGRQKTDPASYELSSVGHVMDGERGTYIFQTTLHLSKV